MRSPAYAKQQCALTSAFEARAQCVSSARWELCGGAARVDEAKGRPYRAPGLKALAREVTTKGTKLNKLVTWSK